nr:unnamed protein product [Digitaria exilis]
MVVPDTRGSSCLRDGSPTGPWVQYKAATRHWCWTAGGKVELLRTVARVESWGKEVGEAYLGGLCQELISSSSTEVKALYVQWHAKAAPGPVCVDGSAPAPAPIPAMVAENPAVADQHGGSWPSCNKHGKPCSIETCWDRQDPGRRFYRCPLFKDPCMDCGFTRWLDEEFPKKATKHINSLLSNVESLEQRVENLQEELDELRRRYVTSSSASHCAPRDGQDSQAHPRKVRKLA